MALHHRWRAKRDLIRATVLGGLCVVFLQAFVATNAFAVSAQSTGAEDAGALIRRYRDEIQSSDYFDPSDNAMSLQFGPRSTAAPAPGPKADAHAGVKGYTFRRCENCHEQEANNLHTIRGNNTCRQCHRREPIASIDHYFSILNPIRRHAYVCAKCHEGSSASFATYVVHEPVAASIETRDQFPFLYYAYWFMFWLLLGVLLIFVPHGIGWWLREWFVKRRREAT
ncbi:MAG: hypothetical protein U9R74_04695 [Pseudomonadota bacterium]|nr:hypothetical protein [Pseudomonadota bacterium]